MPRGSRKPPGRPAPPAPPTPFLHSTASHLLLWILALGTLWFEWTFGALTENQILLLALPVATILSVGNVTHPHIGKVTPFFPFLLATLLLCGTPAAVATGLGAGIFAALLSPRAPARWKRILFGSSRTAFAVWMGGWFFLLAGGRPAGPVTSADLNGLLAAMAGYLLVFSLLTVLRRSPSRRDGFFPVWRRLLLMWAPGCIIGVGLAAAIGIVFDQFGWRWGLALTGAVFGSFYIWKFYLDYVVGGYKREMEITEVYLSIIEALACAIEAKERQPDDHLRRVQFLAVELARMMQLPRRRIEALRIASLLHDIGKLAVPAHILSKPGRLTAEEFDRVAIHPEVGAEILESMELPYTLAEIVRSHHERFDGTGYPDRLRGRQIPVGARILAVIDSYDALTSDRPYRKAVSKAQAVRYLQDHAGTDYDPEVVGLLAAEIDRLESEWSETARRYPPVSRRLRHWTEEDSPGEVAREAEEVRRSLLENISSSHNEIYSLYEMVETLGRSLNLAEIMTLFAEKIAAIVRFEVFVLYLLDKSKQELVPRFAAGADIEMLKRCRIPMGERVSGWAAYHKKAMIGRNGPRGRDRLKRPYDWEELGPASPLRNLRSSLVAPLSNDEGEIVGVLSFYAADDGCFQEDHLRLVKIVSKHVAAAVRNALQYEESQEHALTDPLTTLPNARYLFVSFEEELTRASNLRIPLTIVEIDVDNFKDINDVFGHLFGDKILRGIAKAIRTQLRGCDNCVRYAGDEFIVILPGVGREDVEYVERRLASCIERAEFNPRPGKSVQVKISLGSATFPDEGNNFETLIGIADARMYAGKYRKKRETEGGPGGMTAPKGKSGKAKAG